MQDLSNYLKPPARYAGALSLIAVALCVLAAWAGTRGYQHWQRSGVLADRVASLRAAAARPAPPPPSRAEQDTGKRWAAMRAERGFSWSPVLAAIERAGNEDIELLGFQPDKAALRVALSGEGRDTLAVVDFLDRLSAQPGLRDVHLTHQKNNVRGRLATVMFEIRATIAPRYLQ